MSPKDAKKHIYKHNFMQYVILLGLLVSISYVFYNYIIPNAVEGAVVSLFKPEGDKKLGDFDGVRAMGSQESSRYKNGGPLKGMINTEFIFDFTTEERTEAEDGYTKLSNEWIVKAPKLGEEAIVLQPTLGFSILALVFGAGLSLVLTMIMPSALGYMAFKVDREIGHTKSKIRLQTGFNDDIVNVLTMSENDLEASERDHVAKVFRYVWDRTEPEEDVTGKQGVKFHAVFDENVDIVEFRNEVLYLRIKEFFSDFVMKEIIDTKEAQSYSRNRLKFMRGLRLYMSHHFTEKYANNVTGLAYFGAAILIIIIGIRGLKFIPPTRPSMILGAIFLEGSMLGLLAFTLVYTEEEERMDRMLKKMEDASRNQLETLEDVSKDMHKMSVALVEGNSDLIKTKVNQAVTEYLSNPNNLRGELADELGKIVMNALSKGITSGMSK
ncbi:MAG: hypothetical protein IPM69_14510 [Ignavibacteria bacterium]|nr:hypothetical protein [Ignavibacteria bacterium]